MSKGEATRQAILDRATAIASRVGLEGLSIGSLAEELKLSKSGLFAHFRSKEALQVQVLEHAAARFVDLVIRPALKAPRGERRLRALFQRWLDWPEAAALPGGCVFVAVAGELDDRPGPARDVLVRQQKDWLELIAGVVRAAVDEGQFRPDVDPDQVAFELYGILLVCHMSIRLLSEPKAQARAKKAFEALVARART